MEVMVGLALLVATVLNLVDLVRRVAAGQYRPAAIQALSYVLGFVVAWLFSVTPFADTIDEFGVPLSRAGIATLVVMGLALGAAAGTVKDFSRRSTTTTRKQ